MSNVIKQYVRGKNNAPVGLMVATVDDENRIILGWSMCSPKDKFDKDKAYLIAYNRMHSKKVQTCGNLGYNLPDEVFDHFVMRAIKYFQTDHIPFVTGLGE